MSKYFWALQRVFWKVFADIYLIQNDDSKAVFDCNQCTNIEIDNILIILYTRPISDTTSIFRQRIWIIHKMNLFWIIKICLNSSDSTKLPNLLLVWYHKLY